MQDHEAMNELFDRLRSAYIAWAENFWEWHAARESIFKNLTQARQAQLERRDEKAA